MRAKLPGPLAKTYPLSEVGDAVVDGIARRRRWVTVPSWIRAAIMLRGPLQMLGELGARRESRGGGREVRRATSRTAAPRRHPPRWARAAEAAGVRREPTRT